MKKRNFSLFVVAIMENGDRVYIKTIKKKFESTEKAENELPSIAFDFINEIEKSGGFVNGKIGTDKEAGGMVFYPYHSIAKIILNLNRGYL